jgi:WD40 repeat protein
MREPARSPASAGPGVTTAPRALAPPVSFPTPGLTFAPLLLPFRVAVRDDPEEQLEGEFDAELRTDGLHLRQAGAHLFAPVGGRVECLRGGRFRAEIRGRLVAFSVRGLLTRKAQLARDVCSFLAGSGRVLPLWGNSVPPSLLALGLLPLGVPALAVLLNVPETARVGLLAAVWLILGVGLASLSIHLVWARRSSEGGHVLRSLGLAALGYALLPAAGLLAPWLPAPLLPADSWVTHPLVRGEGSIDLPGRAEGSRSGSFSPVQETGSGRFVGVSLEATRAGDRLLFSVRHDIDARWDLTMPDAEERCSKEEASLLKQFPGARVQRVRSVGADGWEGREWVLRASGRTVVARLLFDRDESVLLTAAGRRLRPDDDNATRFFESLRLPTVTRDKEGRVLHGMFRSLENGRVCRTLLLQFSNDGKRLLGVDRKGLAKVWDAGTLQRLHTWKLPLASERIRSASASPDGKTLAVGSVLGGLVLLDAESGKVKETLPGSRDPLAPKTVTALAFSADGKTVYQGNRFGSIQAWDVEKRERRHFPRYGNREIDRLVVSPDGTTMAAVTCFHPQVLRLPDCTPLPGWRDWCIRPLGDSRLGAAYSHDGRWLATTTHAGQICLWDTRSFEVARTFETTPRSSKTLAFSRDGRWLASGDDFGRLRLWDVATGEQVASHPGPMESRPRKTQCCDEGILGLAFSPDDRLLAVGHDRGAFVVETASLLRGR